MEGHNNNRREQIPNMPPIPKYEQTISEGKTQIEREIEKQEQADKKRVREEERKSKDDRHHRRRHGRRSN